MSNIPTVQLSRPTWKHVKLAALERAKQIGMSGAEWNKIRRGSGNARLKDLELVLVAAMPVGVLFFPRVRAAP